MSRLGVFILACVLVCIACNDGNDKPQKSPKKAHQIETSTEVLNPETVRSSSGRDMTHKRGSALSILDFRISNDTESSYTIIEKDLWEYQFVHNGKKMSEQGAYDGSWVDFNDDHTYRYGKYDSVEGEGKYHYDFENLVLLMIDNDKTKNPEEWNIKFGSDVMIMIGTPEYGNNNFQKKLLRKPNLESLAK